MKHTLDSEWNENEQMIKEFLTVSRGSDFPEDDHFRDILDKTRLIGFLSGAMVRIPELKEYVERRIGRIYKEKS